MAKTHQRALALILAAVFLGTSVITGIAVLWQISQDNQQNNAQTNNTSQEAKLQGTKLKDFTPVAAVDSLQIVDLTPGNGDEAKEGATVTAHYTGALAKDGTIFESSHDSGEPATFQLSGVIPGWQQGVPGMKVGGKRRLVIPASLAYGEEGSPPVIGPNEPLVFDIELQSVQQ